MIQNIEATKTFSFSDDGPIEVLVTATLKRVIYTDMRFENPPDVTDNIEITSVEAVLPSGRGIDMTSLMSFKELQGFYDWVVNNDDWD